MQEGRLLVKGSTRMISRQGGNGFRLGKTRVTEPKDV